MSREVFLIKLEKQIRYKMNLIERGIITPRESKIGFRINLLKEYDEALYELFVTKYKKILNNLDKSE